jgi:hypothetical protein
MKGLQLSSEHLYPYPPTLPSLTSEEEREAADRVQAPVAIRAWWHTPVNPAPRRWKQQDHKFQDGLILYKETLPQKHQPIADQMW